MTLVQEDSYSQKSELVVLGYAISCAEGLRIVCTILKKEDFYSRQHQSLFAVLRGIYQKGFSLDAHLLCAELKMRKMLTELGGVSYVAHAVQLYQDSGYVEECIEEVKRLSIARHMKSPEFSSQFNLVTCRSFLRKRDWPTASSLRYYIFFNKYGFAEKCVKRIGRKVLIDLSAFDVWLHEQAK